MEKEFLLMEDDGDFMVTAVTGSLAAAGSFFCCGASVTPLPSLSSLPPGPYSPGWGESGGCTVYMTYLLVLEWETRGVGRILLFVASNLMLLLLWQLQGAPLLLALKIIPRERRQACRKRGKTYCVAHISNEDNRRSYGQ